MDLDGVLGCARTCYEICSSIRAAWVAVCAGQSVNWCNCRRRVFHPFSFVGCQAPWMSKFPSLLLSGVHVIWRWHLSNSAKAFDSFIQIPYWQGFSDTRITAVNHFLSAYEQSFTLSRRQLKERDSLRPLANEDGIMFVSEPSAARQ